MFKVVILGCENSHAGGFLTLINKRGLYPELEVIGVYSDDRASAEKLNASYGVPVMDTYDELVGKVDAVIVTARHGDNHLKYASPYMESGVPMFIDKPITCSEEDAIEMARLAKKYGVKLCGGSICAEYEDTVKLADMIKNGELTNICAGHVVAPFDPVNAYGNFYFYTEHLVDMMTRVFGTKVLEISCSIESKTASVIARYENFNVTGTYAVGVPDSYAITVYAKEGIVNKFPKGLPNSDSYRPELDALMSLLHGEEMKKSYEDFVLPTFLLNAMVRSNESRKFEKINEIII